MTLPAMSTLANAAQSGCRSAAAAGAAVVLHNGDRPWRSASQVRDLVAPTGPALAPFQPRQRHAVLDERHAAADDLGLPDLMRWFGEAIVRCATGDELPREVGLA